MLCALVVWSRGSRMRAAESPHPPSISIWSGPPRSHRFKDTALRKYERFRASVPPWLVHNPTQCPSILAPARLPGASWEAAHSTSGWVVLWGNAAISWGSRKQQCIALSTCEAEIIALSEAAKDVVYLRKLVAGLGGSRC